MMKKILFCLILMFGLIVCLFFAPNMVNASEEVEINETNFPDTKFRSYVSSKYDKNNDKLLSENELDSVTEIYISVWDVSEISDLKGIEFFCNLKSLNCQSIKLKTLDLSKNKLLQELYCNNNKITSLNVSGCTELTTLFCNGNKLTELILKDCVKLETLDCWTNELLSTLDISDCINLKQLDCRQDNLSTLDLTNNPELTYLECSFNKLTTLDTSNNLELKRLMCASNLLTSLDVSNNTELTYLYCSSNQLTSLDVRNNIALTNLHCSDNQLTSLDISNCLDLGFLICSTNNIRQLDICPCSILLRTYTMGNIEDRQDYLIYTFPYGEDQAYELCVDYATVVVDSYPLRVFGSNRYETSIQIAEKLKEVLEVEKFQNIILVSGKDFPDGLSASYLASKLNAPILTTSANEKYYKVINEYVLNNLADAGTVYIIGGESAIPASSVEAFSGMNCVRLAGDTRYATNLEILKICEIEPGTEVLIATGTAFPDSLSVSSTGLPLILVNGKKGTLTSDQKSYLKALGDKGCTFTIIGGNGAVSEDAETLIEKYTKEKAKRIAGGNRYTTSTAIAEKYFPATKQLILAFGNTFPDALCAGPLGAVIQAPIVLTKNGYTRAIVTATKYAQEHGTHNGIHKGYVLGGAVLISDEVVRTILGLDVSIPILER